VRIFNFLLFEASLEGSGAQLRSDDRFNSLLGCADQLAFHVIADQISAAGTLFVQLLESADGVIWNGRPCHAFITLTPGASSRAVLRDAGTAPALGLIQVLVGMFESDSKARVRIWATGRAAGLGRARVPMPTTK
jgi:hypothetical protein